MPKTIIEESTFIKMNEKSNLYVYGSPSGVMFANIKSSKSTCLILKGLNSWIHLNICYQNLNFKYKRV